VSTAITNTVPPGEPEDRASLLKRIADARASNPTLAKLLDAFTSALRDDRDRDAIGKAVVALGHYLIENMGLTTKQVNVVLGRNGAPTSPCPPTPAPAPAPTAGLQIVRIDHFANLKSALEEAEKSVDAEVFYAAMSQAQFINDAAYDNLVGQINLANTRGKKSGFHVTASRMNEYRRKARASAGKSNNICAALATARTTGKPMVYLANKQLTDLRLEIFAALKKRNEPEPRLFRRLRDLARFGIAGAQPFLERLDWLSVRSVMADAADFYTKEGGPAAFPPRAVAEDFLACGLPPDDGLPEVLAVTSLPIVRPDGSIRTEHGYDFATQLIYHSPDGFRLPLVPEKPSEVDVAKAKEVLLDLIINFQFAEEADKTNFLAFLLTPVVRHLVDVVPLCMVDAPTSGAGKSLLTDLVAIVATGDTAAAITPPACKPEWAKLLLSLLDASRSIIVFDNLHGILESDALEACLSKRLYQCRVLGTNRERIVVNAATWAATSNNGQLSRDMVRRTYRVRLDPKCAQPHLRTDFKNKNLVQYCKAERGNLIWALLVLVRNGLEKKTRFTGIQLGTFHQWRGLVGGILAAADFTSFLANQRSHFVEADIESVLWEQFLLAIREVIGDGAFSAAKLAHTIHHGQIVALPSEVAAIYNSTTTAARNTEPNALFNTRLAHVLRSHLGTRYGAAEVHLEKTSLDPHLKVAQYCVQREKLDVVQNPLEAAGDVPSE
jgi:hypothetical protein